MGKFHNKKGKELRTTLPDHIMEQIYLEAEKYFEERDIYFERKGSVFRVPEEHLEELWKAQLHANRVLLKKGVLTQKMLDDDAKANGLI